MGAGVGPRELAAGVGGAQGGKAEKQGCEYIVCKRLGLVLCNRQIVRGGRLEKKGNLRKESGLK